MSAQPLEPVEFPEDDTRSDTLKATDARLYVPQRPEWLREVLSLRDRELALPAWCKAVHRDRALKPADRSMLDVLARERFTADRMHGRWRQEPLAVLAGLSRQTANQAIGRLKRHGWLRVTAVPERESLRYWADYPSRVRVHETNPRFPQLVTFSSHLKRTRNAAAEPRTPPAVAIHDSSLSTAGVANSDTITVTNSDRQVSQNPTQKSAVGRTTSSYSNVESSEQDARESAAIIAPAEEDALAEDQWLQQWADDHGDSP